MREAKRKLARDATSSEIFPGSHAPVQTNVVSVMTETLNVLKSLLPGYQFTLFAAESRPQEGRREARFNYMSTAERDDMVAVLRAFVDRQPRDNKVDRIVEPPPTDTRQ